MAKKLKKFLPVLTVKQLQAIGIAAAVITVVITGGVFMKRERQSGAQSAYDSQVKIKIVGYSGSVQLTSSQGQMGDCNGGPGQVFNGPITCNGFDFGASTGGVYLSVASPPPNLTFNGWWLDRENNDGKSRCIFGRCFFNFTNGLAVVEVDFSPGPFSITSGGLTGSNSMSMSWGAANGASSYQVQRNGSTVANFTSTNFSDSGLACGTTYSYQVFANNAGGSTPASNNPLSITTANCPPPPPPPPPPGGTTGDTTTSGGTATGGGTTSGGGTSTGSTSSGGGLQGSGSTRSLQGSNNSNSSNGNTPAVPDTTPPSVPASFHANAPDGKTYVELSWDASTDDVSVKGYDIDRSTDQQNWDTIQSNYSDTTYEDDSTLFATHYFYRIRAVDTSNNLSEYAYADVTTPNFNGNVSNDKDTTLNNDDKTITVFIPAGAIPDNAQCNIGTNDSVLSPNIDNYKTISGPFEVLCKRSDGSLINEFTKPLRVEWKLVAPKNIGKVQYFSYANNWQPLTLSAHNGKTHTDSFELKGTNTFIAMGSVKHTSPLVTILGVLGGLGVVGGGILAFLYRRQRQRQKAVLDDYWTKMQGG